MYLKVIKRKQHLFIECTNDVSPFFTLPVVAIDARRPNRCIAMRANGLSLKATLVHVYNSKALNNVFVKFA